MGIYKANVGSIKGAIRSKDASGGLWSTHVIGMTGAVGNVQTITSGKAPTKAKGSSAAKRAKSKA